ncbi:MAG: ACP S-malonyltransferase [Dehalococcoidia bacterium]|nr:ACP S-malonyltransferase [Dehalococcoidia bacterium]
MQEVVAYVFPGQGSQAVGMGHDLQQGHAIVRETYLEADEALGFPLSELCFNGPEEELRQTHNAQPAILATGIACLRAAGEEGLLPPGASFVAGHSLGEYTALVAASALGFADALRLVRERGRLMQQAGEKTPSGMAAILGLENETVSAICDEAGVQIANLNCPGQVVISGSAPELARAMELARAKGARQVIPLNVSGAFHSRVMRPAEEGLTRYLEEVRLQDPSVPVVTNVSGRPVRDAEGVRDALVQQLCSPVQWHPSVEWMLAQGVTCFVEFGPGRVLSGLIKRINRQVRVTGIGDADSLARLRQERHGPQ